MSNKLFAERFKSARNLSGLSLADLTKKLSKKITRQALHKYEKGEVMPDDTMIALLAEALGVRIDYFFRDVKVELEGVEFRKLKKMSIKEELRIKEETRDYMARYIELEAIIGIQSEFKNPLRELQLAVNSFEDVQTAANKVRVEWGLGVGPVFNVLELLESNSVKVLQIDAGDAFDGMQAWVGSNPVIAINTNRVKKNDRVRFTVMHELGHLVLPIKHLPESTREIFCHQFAGAMLFPEKATRNELGNYRQRLLIQELGVLKQQYGISIQAIVMRLRDLEIISNRYCSQFFFYLNQMNWRVDEPYEYMGAEKSNRFEQLLFRALAEKQISIDKAASLSNQKSNDFFNSLNLNNKLHQSVSVYSFVEEPGLF